jgi:hypothetical protein
MLQGATEEKRFKCPDKNTNKTGYAEAALNPPSGLTNSLPLTLHHADENTIM